MKIDKTFTETLAMLQKRLMGTKYYESLTKRRTQCGKAQKNKRQKKWAYKNQK